MKLSLAQAQDYLRQAGWPENLIVKAAAVMGGESSFRTNAGGPSDASRHVDSNGRWSVGLLQINATDGPAPGTGRDGISLSQLEDPITNLRKAYQQYVARQSRTGNGWGEWGAAGNGSYLAYMAASQAAYNNNAGGTQTVAQTPVQSNPVFSTPHSDVSYDTSVSYDNSGGDTMSYSNPTYTEQLSVDDQGNAIVTQLDANGNPVAASAAPSNDYSGIIVATAVAALAAWWFS